MTSISIDQLLGQQVDRVLVDRDLLHEIRGAMGVPSIGQQREHLGRFDLGDNSFRCDLSIHLSGDTAVLEIEKAETEVAVERGGVQQIRGMLSGLRSGLGVENLMRSGVEMVRQVTGFDRVMAYQFLPSFDGEVVAEAACPGMTPYLGLRYPASDIPRQVRDLMLRMPYRMIADVRDPHTKLLGREERPLDLTLCHGRGVSPIHVEYLQNMGVTATVNLSLIVRGQLWGLFSLHHDRPRKLNMELRGVCELFAQLFSVQLQQEIEKEILSHRRRADSTRETLRRVDQPIEVVFERLWKDLANIVDADGIVIRRGDAVHPFGDTACDEFVRSLSDLSSDDVYAIDTFNSTILTQGDGQSQSAGVLLVQIGSGSDAKHESQIMFFRNEIVHDVRWGGEPEKRIDFGPNGPRLHPRASFDEYIQTVKGKCRPWTRANVSAAMELRGIIQEVLLRDTDAVRQDRDRQAKHQDLLIAELNHRVKNILALVRSIARQTKDSSASLENYAEAFEKRIAALATAHDLIGGSGLQWARLREMVQTELEPHRGRDHSVSVSGPAIGLRGDIAPIMALVLHELATNSVKHGALSHPAGALDVSWKHDAGGVSMVWRESNSPVRPAAKRRGFGMALVERAIPYECNGESELTFHGDGIEVQMWLPSESTLLLNDSPKSHVQKVDIESVGVRPLILDQVLVVEDNMVLAMELERLVTSMGCQKVQSVPDASRGEQAMAKSHLTLAILDINLRTGTSFELAKSLIRQDIPVILASGYDSSFQVPPELGHLPRMTKPINHGDLAKIIESLQNK
ncbi:light-regulated signal transduction histidine kinase (bacteriophytochrome)/CheY-like chemotaxis protein [Rhodopirellula rubra]|uniref:histidine kinase n=2 Tax=Aporhodopirellula rubra TaxID=980271 RepID=A0A7W5E5B3_9BACT|nr:light-regulated signal transduction histidine kinase (bacteriophytochrome)/CheY-like chemotaxis protein [Aporhodopirellula rubra]